MFEIVFLGTSAAAPSTHRGLPAQIILARENRFLIDCGEGTQRQILKSGVGFRKLNRILLTHGHLDHILGLGGLLSTITHWEEGIEFLEIYGGQYTLQRVHDLVYGVALRGYSPPMPLDLFPLEQHATIFEDKYMSVKSFPVVHRGPGNFGFVFEQHAHRPFLEEKATALNIPAGPQRSLLVQGQAITLEDGRIIYPEEVLGDEIAGAKLVHVGDVAQLKEVRDPASNADCLVIEATYLDAEVDVARSVGHITAGEAARMAQEIGVKTLILTHLSRRNSEREVREEAQRYFSNTYVARDFDHFKINRNRPVVKIRKSAND